MSQGDCKAGDCPTCGCRVGRFRLTEIEGAAELRREGLAVEIRGIPVAEMDRDELLITVALAGRKLRMLLQ